MDQLVDGFGRKISSLRVSVTDRCNFRCQYCMPSENIQWYPRDDLLNYEEIVRLVSLMAQMGVRDVRLTGGEPLVRKNLSHLVRMLAEIEEIDDLSLTTNGYLLRRQLSDLVEAGLRRINVSLDSLAPDRFLQLTRRDALAEILSGLKEAERYPQLKPIKVNVVAIRGFTEAEVLDFAELAQRKPYEVRFIEFMPLDGDRNWSSQRVLSGREIRQTIESAYPLKPIALEKHATARRYRFTSGQGEISFINPVTEPFCADCNRIRLTADGKLRTCLFSQIEKDLRMPLREHASDLELEETIRSAVWKKEFKHRIGERGFTAPRRSMSQIGG